jgi:tetratricopeptide (TPR) repeat protein
LAPSNARKEFDQAVKDLRGNKVPQATQHLERAVGAYDKYAAAWHELGRAYGAAGQTEKARLAYEKSVAADSKYAPPYVGLAAMDLQDQNYEAAADKITQAAELDPTILMGVAGYVQAVANFRLNRLQAAEQGALAAEKGPHQNTPQLHALLADIYLRTGNDFAAAAQIRAYLKEAPQGPLVAELREHLQRIEKSGAGGSPGQPRVAP